MDQDKLDEVVRRARERGEAAVKYAKSMPDEWKPGELELHRARMIEDSEYANAAEYVRPEEFRDE